MALHTLADDGTMGWICTCGKDNQAHVSHEGVQIIHTPNTPTHFRTVALPPCTCGAQTFLKVDFTAQELAAPNMINQNTGEPTKSHATAQRHITLIGHLARIGKVSQPG